MEWLNKYRKREDKVNKSILNTLKSFFGPDIDLMVKSKYRREINEIFEDYNDKIDKTAKSELLSAKAELESQILNAKAELKKARRSFKQGKINRDVLFDFEFRLIELRNQLDEILNKLK